MIWEICLKRKKLFLKTPLTVKNKNRTKTQNTPKFSKSKKKSYIFFLVQKTKTEKILDLTMNKIVQMISVRNYQKRKIQVFFIVILAECFIFSIKQKKKKNSYDINLRFFLRRKFHRWCRSRKASHHFSEILHKRILENAQSRSRRSINRRKIDLRRSFASS